jgi:hypothetical protein
VTPTLLALARRTVAELRRLPCRTIPPCEHCALLAEWSLAIAEAEIVQTPESAGGVVKPTRCSYCLKTDGHLIACAALQQEGKIEARQMVRGGM